MLFLFMPLLVYGQGAEEGIASYYHDKFNLRKTACGDIFYQDSLTAAHKTLPYGTLVRVTNVRDKKQVVVKINDRLPRSSSRTIDLSKAAAEKINMLNSGLIKVKIEVLSSRNTPPVKDCPEVE